MKEVMGTLERELTLESICELRKVLTSSKEDGTLFLHPSLQAAGSMVSSTKNKN